jgi:hypothetical protein
VLQQERGEIREKSLQPLDKVDNIFELLANTEIDNREGEREGESTEAEDEPPVTPLC